MLTRFMFLSLHNKIYFVPIQYRWLSRRHFLIFRSNPKYYRRCFLCLIIAITLNFDFIVSTSCILKSVKLNGALCIWSILYLLQLRNNYIHIMRLNTFFVVNKYRTGFVQKNIFFVKLMQHSTGFLFDSTHHLRKIQFLMSRRRFSFKNELQWQENQASPVPTLK